LLKFLNHTQSAKLLSTSDRPVAEATYFTKHTRNAIHYLSGIRTRNPTNQLPLTYNLGRKTTGNAVQSVCSDQMSIPTKVHSITSQNTESGSTWAPKYEIIVVLLGRAAVLCSLISVFQNAQNHVSVRYGLKETHILFLLS
jgi:hypothetical protein